MKNIYFRSVNVFGISSTQCLKGFWSKIGESVLIVKIIEVLLSEIPFTGIFDYFVFICIFVKKNELRLNESMSLRIQFNENQPF